MSFVWPLEGSFPTNATWQRRGGPRSVGFASERGGGRLHAACDLTAPAGTMIRAICAGEVLDYRFFYSDTWALVVRHQADFGRFIVRYGEVLPPPDGIRVTRGQLVTPGMPIARVGRLRSGGSMLHLEMYTGESARPSLSIAGPLARPLPGSEGGESGERTRRPETYSEADRAEIRHGGWHWDFQRRLDLADPTDLLIAIQAGRTPAPPEPLARGSIADLSVTYDFDDELVLVTPTREHLERRRRAERATEAGRHALATRRGLDCRAALGPASAASRDREP